MTRALIPTKSGRWVELGRVQAEDIVLDDIAWHLAAIVRFTGATNPHGYSVGEHSVRVKEAIERAGGGRIAQAQALLHDAAEAYLGDVSAPLKSVLPTYRALEAQAWGAIAAHFDLPGELHPTVVEADGRMFATEWRDLMKAAAPSLPIDAENPPVLEPYPERLTYPWAFASTYQTFLGVAEELGLT